MFSAGFLLTRCGKRLSRVVMKIVDLGCVSYDEALLKQKAQLGVVIGGGEDVFFMCEHPLTMTLGRKAKRESVFLSEAELRELGYSVFKADRGGDVTLHMPGQLVVYPIIQLKRRGWDIISYLHKLEEAVVDFLQSFGIVAKGDDGRRGVWIGSHKVASIGIGVSRWVTFHGVAINVSNDLDFFRVIRPCGLDVHMTSVQAVLGVKIDQQMAMVALKRSLRKVFDPL